MSHFRSCEVEFKDLEMLVEALNELGFKVVEHHKEAQPLVGYQGDTREVKAHVIIRRQYVGSLSNDIGFELKDGKAIAHISDYDLTKYGDDWLKVVKGRYAVKKVVKEAKRKGYQVRKVKTSSGTRITLSK